MININKLFKLAARIVKVNSNEIVNNGDKNDKTKKISA